MLGTFHYHGLIRKYIAVFGTLFNDITLKRINSSNVITETIKVPLSYGPKQKFLARITDNPNLSKSVALQLPRLGFDLTSMTYDSERKLNSLNQNVAGYKGNIGRIYSPVPYTLSFNLYIMVKNAIDGSMIVEQILPAFKPEFTVTINAVPTMGIKIDMPIILGSVSLEDNYEGDFTSRRALIYTLDFTAKVYFYPNIQGKGFGDYSDETPVDLIRTTITNFYVLPHDQTHQPLYYIANETSTEYSTDNILLETGDDMLLETSGLDFNKVKTAISATLPDNLNLDDEFDILTPVVVKQFFEEGRVYDPVTGLYT